MKTLSSMLILLVIWAVVPAQTALNFKGFGDTAQIVKFKADSLKFTKAFTNTNGENKMLCFVYDDTNAVARENDSCVAEIGYQLGAAYYNLSGTFDTSWSACIPIDTSTSSKRYNPNLRNTTAMWQLDGATDLPIRTHGGVDTTFGTSESAMIIPFIPNWSPYIRFYVKGLTGTRVGGWVKCRFIYLQRGWVYTRGL